MYIQNLILGIQSTGICRQVRNFFVTDENQVKPGVVVAVTILALVVLTYLRGIDRDELMDLPSIEERFPDHRRTLSRCATIENISS